MKRSFFQKSTTELLVGLDDSGENFTMSLSCAESTIAEAENTLEFLDFTVSRTLQVMYILAILVVGIFLNSFVVFLICKFKELRTVSFFIAFQVCVNDMCLCMSYGFPVVINEVAGYTVFGPESCVFIGVMLFFFIFVRDFLLFIFSVDKFFSVFSPFFYPKHSGKIVVALCLASYSACVLLSMLPVPGLLDCYGLFEVVNACLFVPTCNGFCRVLGYILVFVGSVGTVAPVFLYLGLFIKGRKIYHKHLKIIPHEERLISKEDWKASKTFALVFLAVFLAIKPPYVLYVILTFIKNVASYVVLKVTFNIIFVCAITDPLIMMRNTDVKKCLKKIVKKIKFPMCQAIDDQRKNNVNI